MIRSPRTVFWLASCREFPALVLLRSHAGVRSPWIRGMLLHFFRKSSSAVQPADFRAMSLKYSSLFVCALRESCMFVASSMRSIVTYFVCTLFLVGCSSASAGKHLSEAEMRQQIVGEWTRDFSGESSTNSSNRVAQIILSSDGNFTRVRVDGTRKLIGTWKLDGTVLDVTTFTTNYTTINGQKVSTGTQVLMPIISINEHELICAPGVNESGRLRFTK